MLRWFCLQRDALSVSHTLDSSPKGTPFGAAAKFPATTEAVPLGKVAANAVSRRKGYHGKRLCLRESLQNPMKKYTHIA